MASKSDIISFLRSTGLHGDAAKRAGVDVLPDCLSHKGNVIFRYEGMVSGVDLEALPEDVLKRLYEEGLNKIGFNVHSYSRRFGRLKCLVETNSSTPRYLIICFHGIGSWGGDLKGFSEFYFSCESTPCAFIYPNAPIASRLGGFKWWSLMNIDSWKEKLKSLKPSSRPDSPGCKDATLINQGMNWMEKLTLLKANKKSFDEPSGLDEARLVVQKMLKHIGEVFQIPYSHMALLGFSQGAMLAIDLLFSLPEPPFFIGSLSGCIMCQKLWKDKFYSLSQSHQSKLRKVEIYMSHGTRDYVIPFPMALWLKKYLNSLNLNVTFRQFSEGHTIPEAITIECLSMISTNFPLAEIQDLSTYNNLGAGKRLPISNWKPGNPGDTQLDIVSPKRRSSSNVSPFCIFYDNINTAEAILRGPPTIWNGLYSLNFEFGNRFDVNRRSYSV